MKKNSLINKLKIPLIGAAALGLSLLPQTIYGVERFGGTMGIGNFERGSNEEYIDTKVKKLGVVFSDSDVFMGSVYFLDINHKSEGVENNLPTEKGIEFEAGFFLNGDSFISPYAAFSLGFSSLGPSLKERYSDYNVGNSNKDFGSSGGVAIRAGPADFILAYNFRHVSDLTRISFENGFETSGISATLNVSF